MALSPEQRARILEAIRHQLALEYFNPSRSKREFIARTAIGLPAFPRPIYWERRG